MNTRLREQLTEPEILQIACDIGLGVANMHFLSPPLIHRDLKIENVLISGDGVYKLCDFGSASILLRPPRNAAEFQILDNDIQSHTTAQYRAPEMVEIARGFPIDEKSDIWAFGVFIYKLCYYTTPFEREGNIAILNARFTFPPKPAYSERLKRVIKVTLSEDPRLRPNIFQCLKELYNMRGLEVPIKDIYTAPTSTTWKDVAIPQQKSQSSLPVQDQTLSSGTSTTIQPAPSSSLRDTSKPVPSQNLEKIPSVSSTYDAPLPAYITATPPLIAVNRKTPEVDQETLISTGLESEEDAETKYPTIEELTQSLGQQSFNYSPSLVPSQPSYPTSTLYTSSFSALPQAVPVSTAPPSMPITIAKPVVSDSSYNSSESTSSNLKPSVSPWGSYNPLQPMRPPANPQPSLSTSYSSTSNFPSSFTDMTWQNPPARPAMVNHSTMTSPLESRSHTPAPPSASYPKIISSTDSSSSSSSSSDDDANIVGDGTQGTRTINLNRSNSTASIRRPPSSLSRGGTEETGKYASIQGNKQSVDDRIQRPRPVSLYVRPSDSLLDIDSEVPIPTRSYSRGAPLTEPNLIDPLVTDEKDNLKALLTGLSEKSNMIMLNNGGSNADYVKALTQSATGKSRQSRSPSGRQYDPAISSESSEDEEHETYIKSRSTSHQGKRTSMSLKSKINDAFKKFESPASRSASGQQSRAPRTSGEYGSSYLQNKRLSYSTDDLSGYGTAVRESSTQPDPETVVRQASFMETEDPAQFERPKAGKYHLTATKSAASLGQYNSNSHASRTHPAYSIQSRIQALINRKQSPPPRTATGYGKYTDSLPTERPTERSSFEGSNPGLYRVNSVSSSAPTSIKPAIRNSAKLIDYNSLDHSSKKPELEGLNIKRNEGQSKHIRQLSSISSESSSTENSANGLSSSMGKQSPPKRPSKPKHLQSPRRVANDLEEDFFKQTSTSGSLEKQPMNSKTSSRETKNLMDDRSPGLGGNEDWKEVFNKKYPSLA